MKSRVAEINERGWANGWHAEELARKAKAAGVPMADMFVDSIKQASAFNVPAKCTKVTTAWIYYEFSDGSTAKFLNTRGK